MLVRASAGTLFIRFKSRFGASEAERLREAILAFAPLSELVIDFTDVREFEDVAIVPLARTLGGLKHVPVRLRGLTLHQARMLRYFGIEASNPAQDVAGASAAGA